MARQVEMDHEEVSEEELQDLLNEGQKYLGELRETLKDIKVPVTKNHPQILEAIKNIFGNTYITKEGTAFVTYDMFLECMNITRNVGRATAAEFV